MYMFLLLLFPGLTCLLLAVQKHQNKVFKLLVSELGAKSVTHANSSGVSAAHVAASIGQLNIGLFMV